jgi:hypothetical protein
MKTVTTNKYILAESFKFYIIPSKNPSEQKHSPDSSLVILRLPTLLLINLLENIFESTMQEDRR